MLKDSGIRFDVSADGAAVLVPYGNTAQARMLLAEKGLPVGAGMLAHVDTHQPTGLATVVPPARARYLADIAATVGYPVLVRPSYVLGGRAMQIVYDEPALRAAMAELTEFGTLGREGGLSAERPVLVDRFLEDATEVDVDAVCDGTDVYIDTAGKPVAVAHYLNAGDFSEGNENDEVVLRDPSRGVYKRVILRDNRIVGAVLYGDTADGSWYFDLLKKTADVTAMRDTLVFGQAYQGGVPMDPAAAVAALSDEAEICGCNGVCKGTMPLALPPSIRILSM